MDSAEVPAPLQQHSNNLVCDVCNIECKSPERLNSHYDELPHKIRSRDLAQCLFGYLPEKQITCLDDIYNDPKRKGSLIGLQYLKLTQGDRSKPSFSCRLCGIGCVYIFHHLVSMTHKKNYIEKHFSFLFENIKSLSVNVIAKIAVVIEDVEGIQKFKTAIKNPIEDSALEYPCRETLDKIVEQLQKHRIDFKNPYQEGNTVPCLATGSPSSGTNEKKTIINPSAPSKASENSYRQKVDDQTEKPQNHRLGYKNSFRKEGTVPSLKIGSHSSGTNEKKIIINQSLPSKPPSANPIVQIQGIGFKGTCRKENTVSCLETESHASGINERTGKRPSQFTPLAAFKRRKSELPRQYAGKPIVSLSRPVPMPFSSAGDRIHENNGKAPKPIPSLCRSYQGSSRWPPVEENLHSWQPAEPFYQKAEYRFGYNSDQSLYDFANTSVCGQANSVSDVGQAYAVEGQTWGQETGHPGVNALHTLEMTAGSVSSPAYPSGQCSTEASLKQDTPSRYGYNSVDSKELSSKSYLPSAIMSVLNKEPSSPTSHGAIHHSEGLPLTTSTSSCVQTSQSTNSSMPAKTVSVLSPDTLKILQGRDRTSVKSILKRLAEYCPELQQVNISLLVDVLFETGALR